MGYIKIHTNGYKPSERPVNDIQGKKIITLGTEDDKPKSGIWIDGHRVDEPEYEFREWKTRFSIECNQCSRETKSGVFYWYKHFCSNECLDKYGEMREKNDRL